MAITADLTTALPYLSGTDVYNWVIGITWSEGAGATLYQSELFTEVSYDDPNYGWTPAPTSNFSTVASLTALVDMDHMYALFSEQYDSVIAPPGELVADNTYAVPS